jgi:hypothetical protein
VLALEPPSLRIAVLEAAVDHYEDGKEGLPSPVRTQCREDGDRAAW